MACSRRGRLEEERRGEGIACIGIEQGGWPGSMKWRNKTWPSVLEVKKRGFQRDSQRT